MFYYEWQKVIFPDVWIGHFFLHEFGIVPVETNDKYFVI